MEIGKQSNLNDLLALKAYLETQIEEAKAIKVGEVSQIEAGSLENGSIYSDRPAGVYRVGNTVNDISNMGISGGDMESSLVLFDMHYSGHDQLNTGLLINFRTGEMYTKSTYAGVNRSSKVLTSQNTIIDVNGFIKAA